MSLIVDSQIERSHKAEIKRALACEELALIDVLRDPPQSARLDEILLALPRFGESRLERTCIEAKLYARRRLVAMSEQERGRLVLYLRAQGWLS